MTALSGSSHSSIPGRGVGIPPPLYEGYPKDSGLAAWIENCKWYSSLPLGAVVPLFCESV
jgi:hypothetical protein